MLVRCQRETIILSLQQPFLRGILLKDHSKNLTQNCHTSRAEAFQDCLTQTQFFFQFTSHL